MTKTQLPRSGASQWSSDGDTWPGRAGFNSEFQTFDQVFAIWGQGTNAARPVAAYAGRYYWATDTLRLWYDNGTVWTEVSPVGGGGAPQGLNIGGSGAEGTSRIGARADHTHGFPVPSTDPGAIAYGGAMSRGASSTVARSDHTHALPALPIASAAPPVVDAGVAASSVGSSANLARQDHSHGYTPPVTQSYTPVWGSNGGIAPSVGSGGSIVGRYTLLGKMCFVSVHIWFGTNPSGGSGYLTVSLPFGASGALLEQFLPCKLWTAPQNITYSGHAIVGPGSSVCSPIFPTTNNDANETFWQNTVAGGDLTPASGRPYIGGVGGPYYNVQTNGRLGLYGMYLIA